MVMNGGKDLEEGGNSICQSIMLVFAWRDRGKSR
jgi:hypothetical protein